jgi:hypothetical protein
MNNSLSLASTHGGYFWRSDMLIFAHLYACNKDNWPEDWVDCRIRDTCCWCEILANQRCRFVVFLFNRTFRGIDVIFGKHLCNLGGCVYSLVTRLSMRSLSFVDASILDVPCMCIFWSCHMHCKRVMQLSTRILSQLGDGWSISFVWEWWKTEFQ